MGFLLVWANFFHSVPATTMATPSKISEPLFPPEPTFVLPTSTPEKIHGTSKLEDSPITV
jgi:hypothetical protein